MGDSTKPRDADLVAASSRRRLARVRAALADIDVPAMVVSHEQDIFYLTGFVGHDSLLLVDGDRAWIICDPRYDEFLDPWRASGPCEVVMGVRHRLEEAVRTLCGDAGLRRVAIQAEHTTLAGRRRLDERAGVELVETDGIVGALRMRKDDLEVALLEQALAVQQEALHATIPQIVVGMTELELSARLDFEMKARGAFKPSFDAIVGAGANSSVIHHQTGESKIEPGVLLVDWGAQKNGYCGDLTRTFGIGELSPALRDLYAIVLESQLSAIAACAPGRSCAEIDAVARDMITRAGYGEHFGHGLGHGLGIDVHEEPYFNEHSTTVLEPGMVMTVEPGIYLPGVGGVRLEDDVLITEKGVRVLSDFPKTLDDGVIEPAGTLT